VASDQRAAASGERAAVRDEGRGTSTYLAHLRAGTHARAASIVGPRTRPAAGVGRASCDASPRLWLCIRMAREIERSRMIGDGRRT